MEWVRQGISKIQMYPLKLGWGDFVEIFIIAFLVYNILIWLKNSRAWSLVKGFVVIIIFMLIALKFQLTTILWIASKVLPFAVTALIIVLQPELRKAIEELGKKNIISTFLPTDLYRREDGIISDRSIGEIAKASVEMGKVKTGALIVMEQKDPLKDYERTGIEIDGIVSSQLLINIFEHNTPLHDGAIIIRGNRIISATCYLPLSDSMDIGKELGTRHRAGIGITEETDALTIMVSEENGKISVAYNGKLERDMDLESLKERLTLLQNKGDDDTKGKRKRKRIWKERGIGNS